MNRDQLLDPHEEEQRIKGSVLGGDNMERETRDRDSVPTTTKMSTNRSTPIYASSPTFPDQEQNPKAGALRQEEDDHKRNAHHDVVPSKVFAKDSGNLAPNQLGEKSTMYRTVNESPSMSKEQPKSSKPNQAQAVDGVLRTGYDLLPSSSKKIDGALSVGDINRDVGVSSKEQPKSSDGLKEKPRIENIKMIKQHEPPKDEADHLSNSETRPRKTIEHPVMHDKEDVVSKESPKNINGRRAESSTTVDQWGGGSRGNIIIDAPNQLLGGQPESSHVKQKDWSSNVGSPATKAPNQLDHPLKEQHQNNFLVRENSTDKNGNKYATSNSLYSSEVNNIPEGVPIDKIGEVPPLVNLALVIQPPTSDEKKNECRHHHCLLHPLANVLRQSPCASVTLNLI